MMDDIVAPSGNSWCVLVQRATDSGMNDPQTAVRATTTILCQPIAKPVITTKTADFNDSTTPVMAIKNCVD